MLSAIETEHCWWQSNVWCASAEEVLAAEVVAKTPRLGSESRDHFDVSEDKPSFKHESWKNEVKTLSFLC